MAGAYGYAFTPDIWPPLAAAVMLAALGLYGWRRRDVPAARVLAAWALCSATPMLATTFQVAAVASATILAWYRIRDVCALVAITAGTCFVAEYVQPGRWLTRRNLALLALPVLLHASLVTLDGARLFWRRLEVGPDGSVLTSPATANVILTAYGMGLVLINAAALVWLLIRSPGHRWPAALILTGQFANRVVFLVAFSRLSLMTATDATVIGALVTTTMYVLAVFGFRMLDPRPAARTAALEQMRDGMVVFDAAWRVASINRAAAAMLGADSHRAGGRTLQQLLPTLPDLCARLTDADHPLDTTEVSLGTGASASYYTVDLSSLHDFRGLLIGRLLMLHNQTEQRRAEAKLVEQQRASAMFRERERLARELHDDLGQVLGYVKMQAQAARDQLAHDQKETADEYLAQLISVAQETHTDVREYILGARTTGDGQRDFLLALRGYLEQFAANYGIETQLLPAPDLGPDAFEPTVQAQLWRIIQEALTNVRKHAHAGCVQVRLQREDRGALVIIQDDGAGFDGGRQGALPGAAEGGHFGLRFMRDRAEEVGGGVTLASTPGQGTRVEVRVPLRG